MVFRGFVLVRMDGIAVAGQGSDFQMIFFQQRLDLSHLVIIRQTALYIQMAGASVSAGAQLQRLNAQAA